jgi:hypothetical protein
MLACSYKTRYSWHFYTLPRPSMPIHSITGGWQALMRGAGPWLACCIHGHQLCMLLMGTTLDTFHATALMQQ